MKAAARQAGGVQGGAPGFLPIWAAGSPGSSVTAEDVADLTGCVVDQHVSGGWVGPPPSCCGVEDEAEHDGAGENGVDHRDPSLGAQHEVIECGPGARLPGCQCE